MVTGPRLEPTFTKPLPAPATAQDGFGVNRPTLREILLAGLGDRVRFGAAFDRFEQVGDGRVRAWFTDGTCATGDLLITGTLPIGVLVEVTAGVPGILVG